MKSVHNLPSRYEIQAKLGEGGFGEVYKAYDSHLKQTLAIKVLTDNAIPARETLTREFETLSKLRHPNLIRVFDYGGLHQHAQYFTMEFVDGENLRDFFRDRMKVLSISAIIAQVLNALSYLHKHRIMHGDIKPENIIIVQDEYHNIETKLLDFGLAIGLGEERKLMSGTIRYLAPEILLHGMPNSPATDLYALGISLIESILSKEVPSSNEMNEEFLENTSIELKSVLASVGIRNPSVLSSFILDLCRIDSSDRMLDAEEATQFLGMIGDELEPSQEIQIDTVFIGRTSELREIERRLTDVPAIKRVLLLSGPRGIGKKALARKAAQKAQIMGFLPIDLTPSSSYFALDSFLDTLCSNIGTREKKRFLAHFPSQIEAGSKHKNNDLDPSRTSVIYAHIIQLLCGMSSSQPLLLMVFDIERSSRDFLLFMIQLIMQLELSDSRISMLITSDADFSHRSIASDELNRLAMSPLIATIKVQPFDDRLLRQFLIECFGGSLLPKEERRDILAKTQGLPLLISAFIKSLIATQVIQNQEGHWILDRRLYKQRQIPTDIDDSLSIAMKDLPEDQETLLQILALRNQAIRPEDLQPLVNDMIRDFQLSLAGLLSRAILVYRDDGTVSFAHPLYAPFAIERMPLEIRKRFGGILADHLVAGKSSDYLRIAQLYILAERVDEATEYGIQAVDKMYSSFLFFDALKLLLDLKTLTSNLRNESPLRRVLEKLAPIEHKTGLPREAIKDYEILLTAAESDTQKAHYYLQLADVHFGLLGNVRESQFMLQKALRFAKKARSADLMAAVYHKLAYLLPDKSIPFLEQAAALSRNTNHDLHLTSLAHLAYRHQLSGDLSNALSLQQLVIRDLHKASSIAQREIYGNLYSISFFRADYRAARRYITKKIHLEYKTENSLKLVYSMSSLAGCYYTEGSFHRMIETLTEAYHTALKYSNYQSAVTILSNLSLGHRTIADYGQSLKILLNAQAIIKRQNSQELNVAFLNKPTMLYLMLGNTMAADFKASARRLFERATKTHNHIGLGHHSLAFALHHLYNLEPDEALPHAKKALGYFRKASDRDDVVHALINLAMIQIARGKPKLAAPHIREAEEIYEAIHCEYLKPLLMLGKGMLARHEHTDDAKKILADALKVSKKMSTRETTWQIQRELALYHKDQDEPHKALAYYRDAVETIKQITETIDDEELKLSYLQVPFRKRVFAEIKSLG